MAFLVYACCAGKLGSNGWHAGCSAPGANMAVDVKAPVGTKVYFRIKNQNTMISQKIRYKYDCATSYVRGKRSSILVLVEDVARGADKREHIEQVGDPELDPHNYVFRYVHVVPDADVTDSFGAVNWVSPGQTREFLLGTVMPASKKKFPPYNPPADKPTWEDLCPHTNGETDDAGLCSSIEHLHQAASNGSDRCLEIDLDGDCFPSGPIALTTPWKSYLYEDTVASTVVFSGP